MCCSVGFNLQKNFCVSAYKILIFHEDFHVNILDIINNRQLLPKKKSVKRFYTTCVPVTNLSIKKAACRPPVAFIYKVVCVLQFASSKAVNAPNKRLLPVGMC